MDLKQRKYEQFEIVDVKGTVNIENVTEFENLLNNIVEQGGRHLVINLAGVKYVCSHSISVIIRMWNKLVGMQGSIRTISTEPEITQLLIASNINEIMPVYSSEEAFKTELANKGTTLVHLGVRKRGQYQIIDITRPISIVSGYDELDQKISSLMKKGVLYIAFNLCSIDNIYSEMAGLISKWSRQIRDAGGNFCLVGLQPKLKHQLSLIGFDKLMTFCESEGEIE